MAQKSVAVAARRSIHTYLWTGLALLIAGSITAAASYFILAVVWLTALGLAMAIIGIILIALGRSIPDISPELSRLFFQSGNDAVSDLLEELGIDHRAIYLPATLAGGQARALIPLKADAEPHFSTPLPRRLIARYGPNPDDVGLLIATLGGTALAMLKNPPGADVEEFEAALNYIFHGVLGLADGASAHLNDNVIVVELSHLETAQGNGRLRRSLGSPAASVAAAITAEAWGKPLAIKSESGDSLRYRIELEILS